jgi:small subunit ribosomal protein S8
MIDPISDMLTRIRNAQASRHAQVRIPASKLKLAIAHVLEREGFIEKVERETDEKGHKYIIVTLTYVQISHARKAAKIKGIEQISKQGQRRYVRKDGLHDVKNGYGISIVSTSQGVMTGVDARRKGLGGELICRTW